MFVGIQHCTGHITTGSFEGRGNRYIQLVKVLNCKLLTIGKELPTFPHRVRGLNRRPQRWEASMASVNSYLFSGLLKPEMVYRHLVATFSFNWCSRSKTTLTKNW